jgi:hypothetical protein
VRTHGTGVKHFHHRIVGDLELAYESMDLRADPDLTMTLYTAEPHSPRTTISACSPPGPPRRNRVHRDRSLSDHDRNVSIP